MRPLVSVVMSAYKWRDQMPQAVESVLGQTFGDIEFLVAVMDDRCGEYLRGVAERDPRVSLFPTRECTLFEALNALFYMAQGTYIAVIHDDDYYLPTFLEALLSDFGCDSLRYTFVSSGFVREDRDGTRARSPGGNDPLATLHHSVLYSRFYIDRLRRRDGFVFDLRWQMAADTDFMHRLLSLGPAKHHDDWLYVYRTWTTLYRPFYRRFQYFIEGVEVARANGFRWTLPVLVRNFVFMFMQGAHYAGISWRGLGLDRIRRRVEEWDIAYK